jgi:hypothetical protein
VKFKNLIIDFELGLYNALHFCFPESAINGCSFHYGQNIWRKIQCVGLSSKYLHDKNFKKLIKNILNLIFVPFDKIDEFYKEIKNKLILSLKKRKFKNSFRIMKKHI